MLTADMHLKLGDFGESRALRAADTMTGFKGTYRWMAPELMSNRSSYTEAVDVYSLGLVLWELLTYEEPFADLSQFEVLAAVLADQQRPAIPPGTPTSFATLLQASWAQNPALRPTAHDVAVLLERMLAAAESAAAAAATPLNAGGRVL